MSPSVGAGVVAAAVATFLVVGSIAPRALALPLAQLSLAVVAIAAAWLWTGGGAAGAMRALAIARCRWRMLLAGLLVGSSFWYLEIRGVACLPWVDEGSDAAVQLTELIRRQPFASALASLVVLPAVCEELVFRGVLARALASRWPAPAAAAVSALAFSAYHMSPLQAVPTLVLGLVLAALTLRARSIAPAILAHAANNLFVVLATRSDGSDLFGWIDAHGGAALSITIGLTTAGLGLLAL